MASTEVLLAIRPQDVNLTLKLNGLGDEVRLVICHTLAETKTRLHGGIGMIACGVHFDSGAMFELLEHVKGSPAFRHIPFYLVLGEGSQHSEPVLNGIRTAARLKGAAGFTDLTRMCAESGENAAYERLRLSLRTVLTQGGRRQS